MSLGQDIERLARIRRLALLGRDALGLLAFSADRRRLDDGEVLYRAGEVSDGAHLVLDGALRLTTPRGDSEALPGMLVGEMALFSAIERPATATALGFTTVLTLPRVVMGRVLAEFPQAAEALRADIAAELAGFTRSLGEVRASLLTIPDRG